MFKCQKRMRNTGINMMRCMSLSMIQMRDTMTLMRKRIPLGSHGMIIQLRRIGRRHISQKKITFSQRKQPQTKQIHGKTQLNLKIIPHGKIRNGNNLQRKLLFQNQRSLRIQTTRPWRLSKLKRPVKRKLLNQRSSLTAKLNLETLTMTTPSPMSPLTQQ